ncbi:hypothetical protein N7537_003462 [Penicillium hordei]|uniref:DRBM domain-containing protein n=1 Tax=Penicillium hordei TaxID=40994 RepID=A0AAD6E9D6_9EURO|nr:uncharacterized protein N7537_003462 [Penicillium hordei]KAJ5606843.1 hypothetical protein N7537_003462 [Penicillium hordei]
MSRKETEDYCNHAFQTFNWTGIKGSLEIAEDSQTAIGEESSARDLVVALLGQTYRLCPEPQRLPLLWNLADIFSPISPGTAHRGSHVMTSVETSSPPSPGHSQPGRTTAHAVALHRYTAALHERGQRENKRLQRIEEQIITLNPPLFKVIVQYGNVTCSGRARTKKEAAHLGAKEICRQLNETIRLD